MKNLSIFHKVLIVFGIVVLLASFSFLHLINKTYEKALITQGRNIAQLVITFRKWIANYGTV
jgi:type II secretory pathway pseudopilin PulG